MQTFEIANEIEFINSVKKKTIDVVEIGHVGHVPSCLSSLEILYVLYTKIANITKENAKDLIRDRVIISKEHCYAARAVLLASLGLIPEEYLSSYIQNDGYIAHDLYGYVGDEKIAAMDISSGSLGHGLGVGIGLAYNNNSNVYVICGDGEMQEGSCWEALMFIAHNNLKNLTVIIDKNNMQIDGYTKDIIDTSSTISKKITGFGFDIIECDGHNIIELENAFRAQTRNPKCIVANTVKGREMQFLLKDLKPYLYHSWNIPNEKYIKVKEEIDKNVQK